MKTGYKGDTATPTKAALAERPPGKTLPEYLASAKTAVQTLKRRAK